MIGLAFALAVAAMPRVPAGFTIEPIAHVERARELVVTPNGDLLVGTSGTDVEIVPDAQGAHPGAPHRFTAIDRGPAAGLALHGDTLYIGGQFGVLTVPYRAGDRTARAAPKQIDAVRTSGVARDHTTTSVAVSDGHLFIGVGSPCNACTVRNGSTRATIQEADLDGKAMHRRAVDIRNPIALADGPNGDLWAGVAGRDDLEHGQPYEIFDDVTSHSGTPDYGWMKCYDDRRPIRGANCDGVVVPLAAFPAYETPIGAAFIPAHPGGAHAFPAAWRDGFFVTLHGSWHTPLVPPRVVFVPFTGDRPAIPVDWSNPDAQWHEFVMGCQDSDGSRICRPTGVAVGTDGSLFVSEDQGGTIYRIRPTGKR